MTEKTAAEIVNDDALWEAECARLLTPEGMRSFEHYSRSWGVSPETALKAAQNRCRLLARRAVEAGKDPDLPDLLERPLDNLDITAVKRAAKSLATAGARAEQRQRERDQDAEDAKLAEAQGLQTWTKTGLKGASRDELNFLVGSHEYVGVLNARSMPRVGLHHSGAAFTRWEPEGGSSVQTAAKIGRKWGILPPAEVVSAEPVTVINGMTVWEAKLGQYTDA